MNRKECLEAAGKAVLEDRENAYGSPKDSFGLIANLWGAYLNGRIKQKGLDAYITIKMTETSVAHMMILLKIARAATGKHVPDNYIDIAGYAACAAEIGGEHE